MATTQNQQYSPAQIRQIRAAQAAAARNQPKEIAPLPANASYEQQIEYNKQQLAQQKQQLAQYEQSMLPGRRTAGFTSRQQRRQSALDLATAKSEVPKAYEQIKTSEGDIARFEQQVGELRAAEKYAATWKKLEYAAAKGMLWAHLMYGDPYEQSVARDMQKAGYDSSYMGMATQKAAEQRAALLKEIRLGNVPNVTISGNTIKDLTTNKPIGISKVAENYYGNGFKEMNASGYYNPKTGELQSMKPEDAARLGYLKVTTSGFNPKTGQYIINSPTGLLTSNQLSAYSLFKEQPKVAQFFAGAGRQIQSSPLSTQFVVGGTQAALTAAEKFKASPFYRGPVTTYELAGKQAEYNTQQSKIIDMANYKANPDKFINLKGYGYDEQGNKRIQYSGEASAVTPEDILTVVSIPKGVATFGAKKVAAYLASEPATALVNYFYEKAGSPQSWVGKFGKASIASYLISRSPTLATAYAFSLLKSGVKNSKEVLKIADQEYKKLLSEPKTSLTRAKDFITSPTGGELLGFALGGALLKRGLEYGEWKLRGGVESKNINIPGYGSVVSQDIPKYGNVIWIKGSLNASEKISIMLQINKLLGPGRRVFVQVSSQGIPSQIFSSTKNLGFEVKQLSNPMRGLYQAPPFEFLKKYRSLVNTETGALSYYAGSFKRDSIIPRPLQALKSLLSKDTYTNQRAFQYLESTYKGVNTPSWIKTLSKSLIEGKGIPKQYQAIINKYFKSFMEKPIQFEGKTYSGLEKLNLLNARNLKGMGNGDKLKVYAALLEYQNLNKLRLVSGPENLSGILPYGGESQLVSAIGIRFFEKSLKDLRKGVKPSPISKIVEFLTGTKRGQAVVRIDGRMVEVQPVRAFPGKVKKIKLPSVKKAEVSRLNKLLTQTKSKGIFDPESGMSWINLLKRRAYSGGREVTPPRPTIISRQAAREPTRIEGRSAFARYITPIARRELPRVERRATRESIRRELPRVERFIVREQARREQPRRPDQRLERLRQREIIRRETPNKIISNLIIKRTETRRQPQRLPPKKKLTRYNLLPTLTQEIYKIRRKGGPVRRTRGFEIART